MDVLFGEIDDTVFFFYIFFRGSLVKAAVQVDIKNQGYFTMVYSLQFSVNCKLNPLKKVTGIAPAGISGIFDMLYDYFYEW